MHVVVDMAKAERAGCRFYLSAGNEKFGRHAVPADCIVEIRSAGSGSIEWADGGGGLAPRLINKMSSASAADIPVETPDAPLGAETSARVQVDSNGYVKGPGTVQPPFFKTTKHSLTNLFDSDPKTGALDPESKTDGGSRQKQTLA